MNDRELVELAAKAAAQVWNPLIDDGDAFRLAVDLHINIEILNTDNFVRANVVIGGKHFSPSERYTDDAHAATRRAIVRAAAEIAKQQEQLQ